MKNREIRIIPMNDGEFENRTIAQVQQDYFVNDLPNRPQCEYNYRASGLSSCDGSLVLFQYKNRIVASAIFKESVKYKEPLEGRYKGYLSFYKDTIQILKHFNLLMLLPLIHVVFKLYKDLLTKWQMFVCIKKDIKLII